MKLYKEYKQEKQRLEQEERDRAQIGLQEQTVIIYEQDTLVRRLSGVVRTVILLALIALAGACIVGLCVAFG